MARPPLVRPSEGVLAPLSGPVLPAVDVVLSVRPSARASVVGGAVVSAAGAVGSAVAHRFCNIHRSFCNSSTCRSYTSPHHSTWGSTRKGDPRGCPCTTMMEELVVVAGVWMVVLVPADLALVLVLAQEVMAAVLAQVVRGRAGSVGRVRPDGHQRQSLHPC